MIGNGKNTDSNVGWNMKWELYDQTRDWTLNLKARVWKKLGDPMAYRSGWYLGCLLMQPSFRARIPGMVDKVSMFDIIEDCKYDENWNENY